MVEKKIKSNQRNYINTETTPVSNVNVRDDGFDTCEEGKRIYSATVVNNLFFLKTQTDNL